MAASINGGGRTRENPRKNHRPMKSKFFFLTYPHWPNPRLEPTQTGEMAMSRSGESLRALCHSGILIISSKMAEDDADKSVLIIGYEKPWLERSAILINNSFLDDINESVSKENHGSDYENMDDENKQEFKRLKESQVKSLMPACLASSAEKSQNSPDQNKYNRRNKTFSRKSSRESPNRALSRRTSRGSERKSTSNDAKSSSKGERKSQLTNENPQRSPKKHERSKHVRRSSSKKRKRSSSGMERSRISREKLKRKSEDKTEKKRLDSKSHEGKYDRQ